MDKSIAIHAENINKSFKVYFDKGTSLKERVLFRKRRRYEDRSVLRGISMDVRKGEAVGLIGQNGCGKSTMLKLLTRIMYPDSGIVETQGRVSALIELGAGFHPDMSGRENIYINAAIFGLTKQEIDARLEKIIDFSELREYIDNPVRTYSSGMYMRLAFSVAINVDADVLLVDEILAVGDAAFQAKCFNRLREIKAQGTTIVIVSHSLSQIEQICDRSIWICDGRIRAEGAPRDVHPAYLDYMGERLAIEAQKGQAPESSAERLSEKEEPAKKDENRWGNQDAQITGVRLLDANGQEKTAFRTGEPMEIELTYRVEKPLKNPACGIGIFRNDGLQCYGTNTVIDHLDKAVWGAAGHIRCKIAENQLLPAEYTLDVAIHTEDGFAYDYWRYAVRFRMYSETEEAGVVRLVHTWDFR